MDIHTLLHEHLEAGKEFHAVVVSVDIVGSSRLSGNDDEKEQTKEAVRDLIEETLFDQAPMAILSWSGDGGLVICDVAGGFNDVIRFCDLLVGMIPVINRSRSVYNFLPSDMIHLRVVCSYGLITNTGNPTTLTSKTIDDLVHHERVVGITDHVVVTQDIYRGLQPAFETRFSSLPNQGTPLDPCYVLDGGSGQVEIELHKGTSERLRTWIADMALRGGYEELLIFAYTNESLQGYITAKLPNLRVRVLMRNWLVEEKEERTFNRRMTSTSRKAETKTDVLRRRWEKANTIRAVAHQLMDKNRWPDLPRVDIRFYEGKPLLKGAILRRSDGRQTAYIGHYAWDPQRKGGGSPYIGENWPATWAAADGRVKTSFLETLSSRFEELWREGLTYEQMLELDAEPDHEKNLDEIFALNGRPYLIIYPGRWQQGRTFPVVASEDMTAAYALKDMLEKHNCDVSTEVLTGECYPEKVRDWAGHIIALCHRSWIPGELPDIDLDEAPYRTVVKGNSPTQLYLSDLDTHIESPIDREPPLEQDYCLIVKRTRRNRSKLIFVAGLHAIGTLGGAVFLTGKPTLSGLTSVVHEDDFAVVLHCEFSAPERNVTAQILHGPRVWP